MAFEIGHHSPHTTEAELESENPALNLGCHLPAKCDKEVTVSWSIRSLTVKLDLSLYFTGPF